MDDDRQHDLDLEDLDRVDGTGPLGWLILTGASTMLGVMPWTMYLAIHRLVNLRPTRDPAMQIVTDWVVPVLIGAVASGLGALLVVVAARVGRPLPTAVVLGLGAVIGTAVALLRLGGVEAELAFGTLCGLLGAGTAVFVRARHLR